MTDSADREPSRFKLPPKEVQRRRNVFWELATLDNWRAIGTGRPQTFHPSVIDCQFPEDREATLNEAGEEIPSREFPFSFYWRLPGLTTTAGKYNA